VITTPLTLPVTRAERPAPGLPDIDPLTMTIDPMHQLVICASLYRDEARQEHCQFERRIVKLCRSPGYRLGSRPLLRCGDFAHLAG